MLKPKFIKEKLISIGINLDDVKITTSEGWRVIVLKDLTIPLNDISKEFFVRYSRSTVDIFARGALDFGWDADVEFLKREHRLTDQSALMVANRMRDLIYEKHSSGEVFNG